MSSAKAEGSLRLADLTPLAKVLIRVDASSATARQLECAFGATRRDATGSLVVGAGPDEWLVLSPTGTAWELAAGPGGRKKEPSEDELRTVIDMTHNSVVLRLSGTDSRRVLEKLCAIDLSEAVTPDGSCFRSSVARLRCTVIRDDLGDERSYLIESDRSAGQYLFDTILEAGAEFAIEVDGYPDKEI